MRYLVGSVAGATVAVTLMVLHRRYTGALLYWMFTTDVRGR